MRASRRDGRHGDGRARPRPASTSRCSWAGRLPGTVTDAGTGAPLAGITVKVMVNCCGPLRDHRRVRRLHCRRPGDGQLLRVDDEQLSVHGRALRRHPCPDNNCRWWDGTPVDVTAGAVTANIRPRADAWRHDRGDRHGSRNRDAAGRHDGWTSTTSTAAGSSQSERRIGCLLARRASRRAPTTCKDVGRFSVSGRTVRQPAVPGWLLPGDGGQRQSTSRSGRPRRESTSTCRWEARSRAP